MIDNEMNYRTVSQCVSSDWCKGYNEAVEEANEIINRQKAELESSRKHTELWVKKFYEKKAKLEALQMDKEQLEIDIVNERMNLEHTEEQLTVMTDLCRKRQTLIETLQKYYENMENSIYEFRQAQAEIKFHKEKIKDEAVKEFAEAFKKEYFLNGLIHTTSISDSCIDDFVEEFLTGRAGEG